MCKFRLLNADEIECRIGTTKKDKQDNIVGVSVLLYKDARVDMTILDETIGSTNWQRIHEFKDGKLYCTISLWDADKQMWIEKEDVGVESNTEAEKGQASDSFKRACVNWGIGRELYTAPFIWITPSQGENIKFTKFSVQTITYDDKRRIASLVIVDDKGQVRFSYPRGQQQPKQQPAPQKPVETPSLVDRAKGFLMKMDDKTRADYLNYFQLQSVEAMTEEKAKEIFDYEKNKKK